jgi:ABC-2 type transport system permease protein
MMAMMRAAGAIVWTTARQVLPRRRAIAYAIGEAAPAIVYLLMASTLSDAAALERVLVMIVTAYFMLLVPIVSLIVASAVLGAERRDGTLSFIMLRPIPRGLISAAKVLAAIVVAGTLNAFGGLALTAAYGAETGSWNLVLPVLVGGFLATAVYSAIFVPLGYVTDRAVLVGLLFVFVFENGIVFAATGLKALSPWRIGFSAFMAMVPDDVVAEASDFADAVSVDLAAALLRTVVIAVVSIAAMTMVFRSGDLVSE